MTRPHLREVFPADDPVTRWMFVGLQWMSDVWTLEATAADQAKQRSADALLFFRLVLSRLYEGHRLILDAQKTREVLRFIQGLPSKAVAAFDQLEAHYAGHKESWASRNLKPGRDRVSHYSSPESEELKARLTRFAEAETIFVADERTGRVRFKSADAAVLPESLDVRMSRLPWNFGGGSPGFDLVRR